MIKRPQGKRNFHKSSLDIEFNEKGEDSLVDASVALDLSEDESNDGSGDENEASDSVSDDSDSASGLSDVEGSTDTEDDDNIESLNDLNDSQNSLASLSKAVENKTESPSDKGQTSSNDKVTINLPDEYDYDSSDEEDIRNTVGNIPMEWYKQFEHIGYDLLGQKLMKPGGKSDKLDELISKNENPDYWRTILDEMTDSERVLTDEDVNVIRKFVSGKYVDPAYDPYEPWIDFFTYEKMIHPVTNRPADKRSFIPSLWEKKKVSKLVHAIKMGWIKPRKDTKRSKEDDMPKFYDIWKDENQKEVNKRFRNHIPAPKRSLPGHAESYAPPPEYLFTAEEKKKWEEQDETERRQNFVPNSYKSLRLVPSYARYINEQFERCLDLYLCPRQRKMRMNVNADDLIPKLPRPKDLQPFPTTEFLVYRGHTGPVRCISIDSSGRWLASGSEDKSVRVWEVSTGRCWQTFHFNHPIRDVAWNPNPSLCLLAIAIGSELMLIVPRFDDKLVISRTEKLLCSEQELTVEPEESTSAAAQQTAKWSIVEDFTDAEAATRISHSSNIEMVTWRAQGDYFATVSKAANATTVLIHHLAKRKSLNPIRKHQDQVQCVAFHPTRPIFFVATMRSIRIYNLVKHELMKKLMTNCQWLSSMAIHPKGDNIIIGSYDKKLSWFDTELSNKPYQTIRHHKKAIRQVCFHRRYPLFASASDDGTVLISHGNVYDDLLQNPLIVPVKILRGHSVVQDVCVLDCQFHPTQPYIFTAGADSTIRLYTNV